MHVVCIVGIVVYCCRSCFVSKRRIEESQHVGTSAKGEFQNVQNESFGEGLGAAYVPRFSETSGLPSGLFDAQGGSGRSFSTKKPSREDPAPETQPQDAIFNSLALTFLIELDNKLWEVAKSVFHLQHLVSAVSFFNRSSFKLSGSSSYSFFLLLPFLGLLLNVVTKRLLDFFGRCHEKNIVLLRKKGLLVYAGLQKPRCHHGLPCPPGLEANKTHAGQVSFYPQRPKKKPREL